MSAEPKKRGPKSKADKTAEALNVAFKAIASAPPDPIIEAAPGQPATEPVFLRPLTPDPVEVEPLEAFLHRIQRAHIDRDVVVVEAHHPDVSHDGLHSGVYSGFAIKQGPVFVKYSDGSTS